MESGSSVVDIVRFEFVYILARTNEYLHRTVNSELDRRLKKTSSG